MTPRERRRGGGLHSLALLMCLGALGLPGATPEKGGGDLGKDGRATGETLLTVSNFKATLARHNESGILVEFFLPWCGHSQRLRPDLRRAAAALTGSMAFARVDCASPVGAPICHEQDIVYHPSLLLFRRGLAYEYQKRATASEVIKYARRMAGPDVLSLLSLVETVELLQHEQVLVVAFHSDTIPLDPFFLEAAENLKDELVFCAASQPALVQAFGVTSLPTYLVMRSGQDSVAWRPAPGQDWSKVEGGMTGGFSEWVAESAEWLVYTLTQVNYADLVNSGVPGMILFVADDARSEDAARALLRPAAAFRGRLTFSTISGERYHQLALNLGVPPRVLPALVILDVPNEHYFVFPPDRRMDPDSIASFAEAYFAGELEPALKSAEHGVPLAEPGPVYTLVASEFSERVQDPSRDVIVTFGTTWCGFCVQFAPVFERVAQGASKIETLRFYHFDLTANDPLPNLNISSFPTMMIFPAQNKTGHTFQGDRTVDAVTSFVVRHASHAIETTVDGSFVSPSQARAIEETLASVKGSLLHATR